MSEPTGPLPMLTGTAVFTADVRKAQELYREAQDLYREILRRGFPPPVEVLELTNRLAELDLAIRKGATYELTRGALEGPAPVPVAVPAPRSHRRTRRLRAQNPDQRTLWPVVGVIIAAFAGLKHALRHSPAAHAIGAHASLKVAAWATAGAVTAAGVTGVAVVGAHVLGVGASPAGASAGAVANPGQPDSASPFASPSIAARVTHPRAGTTDAHRAKIAQGGILPVPSQPGPSWSSPASQPSGQSQPSSQAPQGPSEGTLSIPDAATGLNVGDPTQVATIELDAVNGPVPWGASCVSGDCADVTLSAYDGSITAGGSQDVTVSFDAAAQAAGGTAVFAFDRQDVTVTWQAAPAPAVAPSPAVTGDGSTDAPPTPDPTSS